MSLDKLEFDGIDERLGDGNGDPTGRLRSELSFACYANFFSGIDEFLVDFTNLSFCADEISLGFVI